MKDYTVEFKMNEDDRELFGRCIRKLLESTFILRDKHEMLYQYVSSESGRYYITEYLKMIGFDIITDTRVGIVMLTPDENETIPGVKRMNALHFTTEQYHLLLVLWEAYLEKLGYSEHNTVTMGELTDKMNAYETGITRSKLSSILKLFKKYSFVDYDNETIMDEDAVITLYPSLQFGWNIAQFRTVAEEYIKKTTPRDKTGGTDDETDDGLGDAWYDEQSDLEKDGIGKMVLTEQRIIHESGFESDSGED